MADHRDGELAKLARMTEDLEPGGEFTERVMSAVQKDARRGTAVGPEPCERVAALTAAIEPRDGFTDAVMESVRAVRETPKSSLRIGWADGVGHTRA